MPTSFAGWVLFLLKEYGPVLLKGAGVTLLLAIVGTFIGCVIGLLVGIVQTYPENDMNGLARSLLRRCKNLLTDMSPMFAGFFVVSINTGATWRKACAAASTALTRDRRKLRWPLA